VVAPVGYGKTTILSQWAEEDRRPFAWVTLDERDNEPKLLLTSILSVLHSIEPIDHASQDAPTLSHLLGVIESRSRAFVLVLDDVHVLRAKKSIEILSAIVDHLPWGSQLALASRDEPGARVGRLRANRKVVELRFGDLKMTPSEAGALLTMAGLDLDNAGVEALLQRTEGWPAALYLAALSLRESPDHANAVLRFGGEDRLVADYLRDEVLSELSEDQITLLTRSAVLDQLSGSLCDAVLQRSGSGRVLAQLERSNLLVFRTDGGSYRYHRLLGEMLLAELRRSEPEREPDLHRRAAAWHSGHADVDHAIRHLIAARDTRAAGELLWAHLWRYVRHGRNATVQRWLDLFTDEEIAGQPALALVAASSQLVAGNRGAAEHWTGVASRGLEREGESASSLEAGVAIMRAGIATGGMADITPCADIAYGLLQDDSPGRAVSRLLTGVASYLIGERETALTQLEEGARRGAVAAPHVQAVCLAQLALLAIDEGDWENANALSTRARAQIERFGLSGYPTSALIYAVSAAVQAHNGRVDGAKIDLRRATDLVEMLADFAPWYEVEVRITLARATLRLSDVPGARRHLAVASRLFRRCPDAVVLGELLVESVDQTDSAPGHSVDGQWLLTTAELRVLQFLPTHLSFPEIAAQLNVSANTVKTHSRAVYRKLDASSRTEAVAHACDVGLIETNAAALAEAA
jgi:LuxR family maltose regulon positive regulatory protein